MDDDAWVYLIGFFLLAYPVAFAIDKGWITVTGVITGFVILVVLSVFSGLISKINGSGDNIKLCPKGRHDYVRSETVSTYTFTCSKCGHVECCERVQ